MNLYVLQNNNDQNSGALKKIYKTDLEEVGQMFFDENHCIDNTNAYVKSKICQIQHFTVKRKPFGKIRLS